MFDDVNNLTKKILPINLTTILLTTLTNIANQIPKTDGDFKKYMKIIKCSNSFFLDATGPLEIDKIIDTLEINTSTGSNSIPLYIKDFGCGK